MYKITNIAMSGNEHGQLRADTIYAKLVDYQGEMVISATLEYILSEIRNREYEVDGVNVEWTKQRGVMCSDVYLHP